jgi:hypothetical protein
MLEIRHDGRIPRNALLIDEPSEQQCDKSLRVGANHVARVAIGMCWLAHYSNAEPSYKNDVPILIKTQRSTRHTGQLQSAFDEARKFGYPSGIERMCLAVGEGLPFMAFGEEFSED